MIKRSWEDFLQKFNKLYVALVINIANYIVNNNIAIIVIINSNIVNNKALLYSNYNIIII